MNLLRAMTKPGEWSATLTLGAARAGALAIGALAVGALAVGAFAIGRLSIGSGRIRRLEIDELVVGEIRAPLAGSRAG
ncbi:hypothetical protein [Sphingosinicella sp. CPCC 101087]|uniref:hypothetical protein n=1 Tax=Sphingosinicella sp. CPCC 101087 TaxID=2497754 RepID=UPI00101D0654|nr:hypothetical protein [Sphingosinicella sp. CPCC 101087]